MHEFQSGTNEPYPVGQLKFKAHKYCAKTFAVSRL